MGLLGLPGDLNCITDPGTREATFLILTGVSFQLAFRKKSLSPELGRLDLNQHAAEVARSAGKNLLANAIHTIGTAERTKERNA